MTSDRDERDADEGPATEARPPKHEPAKGKSKHKVGKGAKPPKPPKPPKSKGGKKARPAPPGPADRVRAAAGVVMNAARTPRGLAVGAAVGLIAGFMATAGARWSGAGAGAGPGAGAREGVPDTVPEVDAPEPAETIGAIMARAAEHDQPGA